MSSPDANHRSLWTRPGGLAEVLQIALPLVISTTSHTLMQFTDRVFLMWHSQAAVAAALPAGMLSLTVVCVPWGIAGYTNTFVAQYYGAERRERIGLSVWQGVWLSLMSIPLVLLTIPLADDIFRLAGHSDGIARLEATYYRVMCYGSPSIVVGVALSSFFSGRGQVRTVMVVDLAAAILNVGLDYIWIFGHLGFEPMGLAGAAWATVAAGWCKALVYLVLLLGPKYRREYGILTGCRYDRRLFGRLLWFGGPSGLQWLFEAGSFTLYLLLVGRLGDDALAASSLAFNVNGLAFMPVFGLGMATSTLVGQRLGQNRPDLAARATWSAFTWAVGLMGILAMVYLFAPGTLLWAHEQGTSPEQFDRLRKLTTVLLRFVAFYCVFDAMNVIFASAVKGAGDTRFVMLVTIGLSFVPITATWLGIEYAGLGIYWAWVVISGYVCLLGVAFWARFHQGKWRSMRVIEA